MPLSLVFVGRTPWSAADALVGLPRADDSVRYRPRAAHLWETRGLVIVITGIYYALALAAAGALVTWLASPWAAIPLWLLALFCLYFFRDPEREIPSGPVAVSPADGMVVAVKPESATQNRISIFLNVFDVHVNRTPIGGTIAKVQYRRGAFHVASREECSVQNEQNVVTVQGKGTTVVFKQIAGLIARRIVFNKKPGDCVSIGERIGLIKFGSRCDVLFGPEWEIVVRPGMRVAGGSSVIARLRGKDQPNVH
jgi:phosphatidylserine decarboxylase